MRISAIEAIVPPSLPETLPIHLTQKPSPVAAVLKLMVLLPATLALLVPFLLVGKALAADAGVRAALMERPALVGQIIIGLAFWAVLFAWPLKRLIDGLTQSRTLSIDRTSVTIRQNSLFGHQIWSVPLGSYSGVIHHVRASLSGLRQELILAHPEHDNSILLTHAPRISAEEIARVSALLGQTEMPSHAIYRPMSWHGARRARRETPVPAAPASTPIAEAA
ncbi:MAG: hypothetical protein ACT4N2_03975 [Hyphomicrobium sp.]